MAFLGSRNLSVSGRVTEACDGCPRPPGGRSLPAGNDVTPPSHPAPLHSLPPLFEAFSLAQKTSGSHPKFLFWFLKMSFCFLKMSFFSLSGKGEEE